MVRVRFGLEWLQKLKDGILSLRAALVRSHKSMSSGAIAICEKK